MARYNKKSIRFFNNREVRAVWDEEQSKWWFSATDVVRAINDEDDYTKSRNYWKYLKGKLMKAGIEVVSATNQFKFEAPDGKMRTADVLDADSVQIIAKHYPNNRASAFLDWFVYSDNSIDGQSTTNALPIKKLLKGAMTDQIEDREIFMKGIDYSYYYEQQD
jgi:cell filamentation protein